MNTKTITAAELKSIVKDFETGSIPVDNTNWIIENRPNRTVTRSFAFFSKEDKDTRIAYLEVFKSGSIFVDLMNSIRYVTNQAYAEPTPSSIDFII